MSYRASCPLVQVPLTDLLAPEVAEGGGGEEGEVWSDTIIFITLRKLAESPEVQREPLTQGPAPETSSQNWR